jgi:hypothetical protein
MFFESGLKSNSTNGINTNASKIGRRVFQPVELKAIKAKIGRDTMVKYLGHVLNIVSNLNTNFNDSWFRHYEEQNAMQFRSNLIFLG